MRDFNQTYRDYRVAMRRHAERRCRDGSMDPEEVVQEAWLRVWQNWDLIKVAEKPGGLMLRLLHQAATVIHRAGRANKRSGKTLSVDLFGTDEYPLVPAALIVRPTQEDAVDLKRVSERLDRIPERQRAILVDRVLGDSLGDIGERLGLSAERVRQIEAQARKRLTRG